MPVQIRLRTPDDISAIRDLMRAVYPPPLHGPDAVWSEQNLNFHISRFPEGQFVAVNQNGQLVGTCTTMKISLNLAIKPHTWSEISGRGSLSTHEPDGEVLYGVNIAVAPDCQGQGVASALYDERFRLARKLFCRAFVAGARIPGYLAVADSLTPEEYLEKVKAGQLFDPTLSKHIKLGFQVLGLLKDYSTDPETMNHAAHIYKEL